MRGYLSAAMRGRPEMNAPLFDASAAALRERGWEIISPVEMDREAGHNLSSSMMDTLPQREFIMRDIPALLDCDVLILLPDIAGSDGVAAERSIAKWARIPVWTLADALKHPVGVASGQ